jgi:hypothetical protein
VVELNDYRFRSGWGAEGIVPSPLRSKNQPIMLG